MRRASFALASTLMLFAACDDPADPCAEHGCGVDGIDLALIEARIAWDLGQPLSRSRGLHVVEGSDELHFQFTVLNRGNVTSEPIQVFMGMLHPLGNLAAYDTQRYGYVDVPALAPGEAFSGSADVLAADYPTYDEGEIEAHVRLESNADTDDPLLLGVPFGDADTGNNARHVTYWLRS